MSGRFEAESLPESDQIKSCCAALYGSEWVRLLLGTSFHPGGLPLTRRLGELLGIVRDEQLLDVAAGAGSSAIYLAQQFGCRVTGIDFSQENVRAANERAQDAGLESRVRFLQGDAERLELEDGTFDVVVCECAFCTFPDKGSAAAELARVLRSGGRLGLADLTRSGELPVEMKTLLAWIACLGDARPVAEYSDYLRKAGFEEPVLENHDQALREMVRSVRSKLLGAELMARVGTIRLPLAHVEEAQRLARAAAATIDGGKLGYSLMVATRHGEPRTSGPEHGTASPRE